LFILCGLAITAFLWSAFWHRRLLHWLILGFGCWVIAQSLDFIEGLENAEELYGSIKDALDIERMYGVTHTFKLAEEVLEMVCTTLLWVGFLHYLAQVADGVQLHLSFRRKD
jgi:hypothetical protein